MAVSVVLQRSLFCWVLLVLLSSSLLGQAESLIKRRSSDDFDSDLEEVGSRLTINNYFVSYFIGWVEGYLFLWPPAVDPPTFKPWLYLLLIDCGSGIFQALSQTTDSSSLLLQKIQDAVLPVAVKREDPSKKSERNKIYTRKCYFHAINCWG